MTPIEAGSGWLLERGYAAVWRAARGRLRLVEVLTWRVHELLPSLGSVSRARHA